MPVERRIIMAIDENASPFYVCEFSVSLSLSPFAPAFYCSSGDRCATITERGNTKMRAIWKRGEYLLRLIICRTLENSGAVECIGAKLISRRRRRNSGASRYTRGFGSLDQVAANGVRRKNVSPGEIVSVLVRFVAEISGSRIPRAPLPPLFLHDTQRPRSAIFDISGRLREMVEKLRKVEDTQEFPRESV